MALTTSLTDTFFLLTILVLLLPVETYAFGAGDIPDFAYLNDKAFRHGDIENILETLAKSAGVAAIGGSGILGFASSVIKHVGGESKFSKSDIKKVYFGNWLRDYSQAMDIAGLSKLSADTLVLVVAVLGFMTFGYATQEFEVTADRLGVYLPVEHIDNPKGYAEKEGDARSFHPKLRPPVSSRELEIDERTGMKKYIATENQGWDTSTAFIRRTFRACIEAGRRAGGREGAELWEAYRLLGTGLHTMEDLLAHSNWCEIALRKMGHKEVFCHVGDRVIINTPNGPAPPLVTGTFGSADFMHSLLGEAGDKLSQASVTDLSDKMNNPSQGGGGKIDISALKNILSKFGGGGDDEKLNKGEKIKQQSQAYNFDPNNIAPPEVQKQLLDLLKWHDDIMRDITKKMEMVPGLTTLLEEFSNALNEYIYTILAPYLGPILTQTTSVLDEGSKVVIDNDDQYEVFDNPNAHDPSHSLLSKDHFGLILNEPAGKIAQVVVEHSVNLIVRAWSDNSNADNVITQVLEAFHHPYYNTGRSEIQNKMFDHMQRWIGALGSQAQDIIRSLTKESVRNHKNKRAGLDDTPEAGYGGCGHGGPKKSSQRIDGGGYASKPPQSYGRDDSIGSKIGYSSAQKTSGYGVPQTQYSGNTYGSSDSSNTYGQGHTGVGHLSHRRDDDDNRPYSSQKKQDDDNYGRKYPDESYSGGGYSGQQRTDDNYGRKRPEEGYGGGHGQRLTDNTYDSSSGYGSQRRDDNSAYGGGGFGYQGPAYGSQRPNDNSRSSGQKRQDDVDDNRDSSRFYGGHGQTGFGAQTGGYNTSYGQPDKPSYGVSKYDRDEDDHGKKSRRGDDDNDDNSYKPNQPSYGGGYGGGYGGSDNSGRSRKDKDDFDDDSRYKSSQPSHGSDRYGGGNDNSYGRSRNDDSDDDKKKFKSHQPSYTSSRKDKDDSDDDNRRRSGKKHDNDDKRSHGQSAQVGYGQSGYGQSGGYAPSYGRDDTFGVEGMNIRGSGRTQDEDFGDDRKKHKHHERY